MNRVGTGVYMREATSEGRMEIHEVIQDGGFSSLVWKYILTGFPGYLREGEGVGCKLRHSTLYFPAALPSLSFSTDPSPLPSFTT